MEKPKSSRPGAKSPASGTTEVKNLKNVKNGHAPREAMVEAVNGFRPLASEELVDLAKEWLSSEGITSSGHPVCDAVYYLHETHQIVFRNGVHWPRAWRAFRKAEKSKGPYTLAVDVFGQILMRHNPELRIDSATGKRRLIKRFDRDLYQFNRGETAQDLGVGPQSVTRALAFLESVENVIERQHRDLHINGRKYRNCTFIALNLVRVFDLCMVPFKGEVVSTCTRRGVQVNSTSCVGEQHVMSERTSHGIQVNSVSGRLREVSNDDSNDNSGEGGCSSSGSVASSPSAPRTPATQAQPVNSNSSEGSKQKDELEEESPGGTDKKDSPDQDSSVGRSPEEALAQSLMAYVRILHLEFFGRNLQKSELAKQWCLEHLSENREEAKNGQMIWPVMLWTIWVAWYDYGHASEKVKKGLYYCRQLHKNANDTFKMHPTNNIRMYAGAQGEVGSTPHWEQCLVNLTDWSGCTAFLGYLRKEHVRYTDTAKSRE